MNTHLILILSLFFATQAMAANLSGNLAVKECEVKQKQSLQSPTILKVKNNYVVNYEKTKNSKWLMAISMCTNGGKCEPIKAGFFQSSCLAVLKNAKTVTHFKKERFWASGMGDYAPAFNIDESGKVSSTFEVCADGNCTDQTLKDKKFICGKGVLEGNLCTNKGGVLLQDRDFYWVKFTSSNEIYGFVLDDQGHPIDPWANY